MSEEDIRNAVVKFDREDLLYEDYEIDIDTPVEVFLTIRQMARFINQQKEIEKLNNIIKEAREYITSYESISTIQGLEDIEANKDLDEKTLNEMIRRYMIVHDKLLEILDKENKND